MFDWLLALSGLSTIFTWLSINVAHIRFRQAWKAQGHSIDELPFRTFGGIWGSVFASVILVLVLIAQFVRYRQQPLRREWYSLLTLLFPLTVHCRLADWRKRGRNRSCRDFLPFLPRLPYRHCLLHHWLRLETTGTQEDSRD